VQGLPLAHLMLQADATVSVCHAGTADLGGHARQADILVAAAGVPGLIVGDMVRRGVVAVDVGISRTAAGRIVGDMDAAGVSAVAAAMTPVPGGVGPVTVAMLMENVVEAAQASPLLD
jgi:methylenetetrahydrofolate dehydrogenase (NADP+) / methenyltetrahydrofolate cyclohydrolase